ncbi:alpha/beta hydrolase [Actinosynnema sp. ALI-1.44]|uniref:alpha/beta hydrolase n=1 Tax=Actinosynnema sp. ALI-1.44 TaxID=1933779 RepID=UPI000A064AD9|nr:alpha/beta hydrolase [Actinosynnema sp. ALI-1.44]
MTLRRRLVVIAVALALVPGFSPAAAEEAVPPKLTWTRCGSTPESRLECASLRVPLDYRHPRGRAIELAISRLPAADPARRKGILLTNPGGPGGSGLGLPEQVPQLLASQPEALARYDVIGMDPRFIGKSTPVTCGLDGNELALPNWPGPGGFAATVTRARNVVRKCTDRAAWAMPYATTANTARDMDMIRAVLGEPKLSFLGYSYGSELGRAYVALFPRRVDRFVLDSNTNPLWTAREADLRFPPHFERMYGLFAAFAARDDAQYGLGTDARTARARVDGLIAEAGIAPIPSGDDDPYTALDIRSIVMRLLYAENRFHWLGRFVATLRARQPLPADIAFLGNLRRFTAPPGVPKDNFIAAHLLIKCGDEAYPRDIEQYRRDFEEGSARYPFLGPAMSGISPCAFWPVRPREPIPSVAGSRVGVLLINSTGDPATPYDGALATRRLMPRSRLVTVPVSHHAVLGEFPNACVERTAGAYLVSGDLPDRDVWCEP